jgi:hypothetical protein
MWASKNEGENTELIQAFIKQRDKDTNTIDMLYRRLQEIEEIRQQIIIKINIILQETQNLKKSLAGEIEMEPDVYRQNIQQELVSVLDDLT